MSIRAAIFDVYGTLLEVGPAPPDAEERWQALWRELLGFEPRLARLDFAVACGQVVKREHDTARARGIAYPEVNWPSVVLEVLPELGRLDLKRRDEFILRQMATGRTLHLGAEAAAMLQLLANSGCVLGIASNAQAYTLRELEKALGSHGLNLGIFQPDLSFWSFQHGFSKPDSHVFQLLSARLELRGISREQTMMVGDRLDNDIEPARRHGWQVWHLSAPGQGGSGGWRGLAAALVA